jgi:hypothetical protein
MDTNPLIEAMSRAADAAFAPAPAEPPSFPDIPSAGNPEPAQQDTTPPVPDGDTPFDTLFRRQTEAQNQTQADDRFPDADALADQLKTPEAKAKWGELRKEHATYRTKAQELEAKVAEYEVKFAEASKMSVAPELENKVKTYEQQIAEYEKELAVARVEATREYRELVTQPSTDILDAAASLASSYEIDEQRMADAILESDPKKQSAMLGELLDGMSERDRARVYRLADDMLYVISKDQELRNKASTAWEEVQAREKAAAETSARQRLLELKSATDDVFGLFEQKKLNDLGIDLATAKEAAYKSDLDNADARTKAWAVAAGNILPGTIKALAEKTQRVRELEATVARLTRATPGAAAGSAPDSTPVTNPVAGFLFGN